MYVEIHIFKKKERMYSKYQEAQLRPTDDCVLIIWVNTALTIHSQNTPSSTFGVFFSSSTACTWLNKVLWPFCLCSGQRPMLFKDTMLNMGLKLSVQKEIYSLGFFELELVSIWPAMCSFCALSETCQQPISQIWNKVGVKHPISSKAKIICLFPFVLRQTRGHNVYT